MFPYPVTFRKFSQERDKEGEIIRYETGKSLIIGRAGIIWATRACTFKLVLQNQTAMVPNRIVLRVPFQQVGRQFQRLHGEMILRNLGIYEYEQRYRLDLHTLSLKESTNLL